ncbi:uncharacterized protein LOC124280901 isoform X2 [Haliotis rubra]|uniref:uncharacterized protein LOC124280901 isoform X1 n=1 Tax=Haliotis rubra TaxID=36100 RepID=UPI001EE5CFBC|nr:uncharacterized protein LOC124280901 isoform X1 [Haliotis rubra]XP_046572842.1 uncharacterized protein LOC124280901 isoform X2 [Haliotis rubra]XP_046572843.1 uncharacterized protein LOC124280901 isoform X2 [Haliotis rubra]XP_046572844.1 uncharacterized protein LOC124280901 isoform X2 [Haliotis rubra]
MSLVWSMVGLLLTVFTASCHGEYLRVCYMTNWSQNRPGDARFTVANITDVSLCTHIIVAFAQVNDSGNTLAPYEWNDDIPDGTYAQLVKLRDSNPSLKVLLAVGGQAHGSAPFVEVVSDGERINTFCDNVIKYIRRVSFDGVDIDWVWPAQGGSGPADKQRYTTLLQRLRNKINTEASRTGLPRLLLTAAVAASRHIVDAGYEVDKIAQAVDFLSVMTFDLDASRGPRLLHHAPLSSRPGDSEEDRKYNLRYSINYWANKGAPRHKLVVGLPFYGRYHVLLSQQLTSLYSPANGTTGFYPYYQICQFVQSTNWTRVWDDDSDVPTIYSRDQWVGYDDLQSLEKKALYIREQQLGGAMFWEIGQDDFGGKFCGQGRYPLLSRVRDVLTASKDDCEPGSFGRLRESGCTLCPRGYYQPRKQRTECLQCPVETNTNMEGARDRYFCVESCSVGHGYSYSDKKCVECHLGFTRPDLSSAYCVKCPVGYTTMTTGSATCVPLPEGVPGREVLMTMYHMTLKLNTTTCERGDVIKAAIINGITNVMADASHTWPKVCHQGCRNAKTVRVDGCGGGVRRRRQAGETTQLTVRVVVENIPEELTSAPTANGVIVTRTTDSVLTEMFFDKQIFSSLAVYGIHYVGLTGRLVEKLCSHTGHVFHDGDCVPCPVGSYAQATPRKCIACPVGTYQDKLAQTKCQACKGPMLTFGTGSRTPQQCLSPCDVDPNYCENNGQCVWKSESLKVFCQCAEPYYGERCDIHAERQSQDVPTVVGGVVGGLGSLIIIGVAMVICCVCYKRRAKTRESSAPNDYNNDDLFYVTGVMSGDFLPTPVVIAADPHYVESPLLAPGPGRGGRPDTLTTPSVILLDSTSNLTDATAQTTPETATGVTQTAVKDTEPIQPDVSGAQATYDVDVVSPAVDAGTEELKNSEMSKPETLMLRM